MSNTPVVQFERLLNPQETALLLGIHPKTLIKLAREKKIPAARMGKLWRFRASAIEAWVKSSFATAEVA